ncbi:bifunctional hydroxymethylpyrimidine kinase/phosphomethylpyrimidine kinase [Terrilactibacillus sp. BCM23-1]|uniref:Hydroxymethylpyrimidine/phosphomethylpyrimidine kinase n=1 Tax=Terrilactibacillus tamarindi TaxID=2599694 RepID=A0A6N8CPQ7_9BACI|nr:bifunctional hydroxymethylpyrimidine kinase/phosphomethylpyrimidine kinase [Terrilactibacillus tamarindi]MTT32112.1 bifunctional hydroxymethylpyrimidine kinase/phosphomethylpyrimidine kinase [Terrilactibacillus tamarindi]
MKTALTIAGSDSSGGAGIQADLKTFSAHGVYGMSVIVSITAQNTQKVEEVEDLSPRIIGAQLDAVFSDITVDAVKIGMVSNPEAIRVIAEKLIQYKPKFIVLDPVMVSKSGYDLLQPEAKNVLIEKLLPLATIVTPNLFEAERLINNGEITTIEGMKEAAKQIYALGPQAVLVKGGHLEGDAVDVFYDGKQFETFEEERIETKNTHGTGCTLSSAIASHLAKGEALEEAIEGAKTYIQGAIRHSLSIGHGSGPTNHFFQWFKN